MKCNVRDAYFAFQKDPIDEDKLVSALENLRSEWHRQRKAEYDHKWQQQISFYSGKHFIRSSSNEDSAVRVKENHTNNIIQRIASIVVQNLPIVRPFAASDQYEDIESAEACEGYLKYHRTVRKLEMRYTKLVRYSLIMGNGFIHRGWDPYASGSMFLSEEESEGAPGMRKWRGDSRVDVDAPFRINVRPGIYELDDMFDYFRSVPTNRQELEAIYGPIEAEPVRAMNAYTGQVRNDDEQCMVHHYYCKPVHWWEDGAYICYAGKRILKAMPFPYVSGKLPLSHLPFDTPPEQFWAMSSMEQIMDLQEQLDKACGMIIEARNMLARPKILEHDSAKIPNGAWTDKPGARIKWQGQVKPELWVPSFNFGELAAHKSDVRGALQGIMGMTGASRGEIPAATKTALALQLVLEQDRSQFAPYIKSLFNCVRETELGLLEMAAQFIDESDPRAIKIEQNGVSSSFSFHGKMVPSPLDVWLEDTNPLGWTSSGRIENAQTLVQAGLIKDPNVALEMLQLKNPDPAYQAQHINRQTAKKENELLNKGLPVTVESEDIDPVHLDEHTKQMQSFSYKFKPDAVKRAFEAHVAEHKARMSQGSPAGAQTAVPGAEAAKALEGAAQGEALPPLAQGGGETMEQLLTSSRAG